MARMIHAGLLVALVALCAACEDSDSNRTPTPATPTTLVPATATPTATRTPKVEPTQRPTPVTVPGRKHFFGRGDTVRFERGILFLDPSTRGGVAWEGAGVSPSGAYVYWIDADGRAHVVNTLTDATVIVGQPGGSLSFRGFNPDETAFAVEADGVLTTHSTSNASEIRRIPLEPGTFHVEVRWSPQNAVAVGMQDRDGASLGVAVQSDGQVQTYAAAAARLEWSPDGRWLAAAGGDELVLIDTATGKSVPAPGSGSNPRWSANGEYVAVQGEDFKVRVFDRDGVELLRVSGICAVLGTPWDGNELHSEFNDLLVAIDGSTRPAEPRPTPGPITSGFREFGGVEMRSNGTVIAELGIAEPILYSWPYDRDGIRSMTDDGRGVFVLGVGGRGFCEGGAEFGVELPPFG